MTIEFKITSKLLTDYLRYLFPTNEDGIIKVSSASNFGKLLIAHCRESEHPIPKLQGENIVILDLPVVSATQSLNNKFIYYSAGDLSCLNLALSAVFDLDFTGYYRRGEKLNMQKKDIIEAFIISRNLVSMDYFDALHKRVYRQNQKYMEALTRKLIRRAYYIDETINTNGLKNDTNY